MRGAQPIELGMAGHEDEVMARLAAEPRYSPLWEAAFPGQPARFEHIKLALACFTRSLISGDSAFDRRQLSAPASRGADLFYSQRLGCANCHAGFNFTTATRHLGSQPTAPPFHNIGLYNLDGAGAYPADAPGLRAFTGLARDEGRFRVPSLRNVELTAPYMHDGSVATLEEVIRIYEAGGRGEPSPLRSRELRSFTLSDAERADLVEFLRALTDHRFVNDPRFADPWR